MNLNNNSFPIINIETHNSLNIYNFILHNGIIFI